MEGWGGIIQESSVPGSCTYPGHTWGAEEQGDGGKTLYHNKPWDLYVFYLSPRSVCGKYDSLWVKGFLWKKLPNYYMAQL